MPVQPPIRVWALLGPHRGDNNQILALAEALGFGFEAKRLTYNGWRRLQPALLGATLRSVDASCRAALEAEPPDLTISTGHRSVPAVRALKRRSGGRMRAVHLGYPRISPKHFDLVVPTPEYPIPDAPNVMRVPFALSPHEPERPVDPADAPAVEPLPHPRRLLVIGGPTLYWKLPLRSMLAALRQLIDQTHRDGGSVLTIGSPRTPEPLLQAVAGKLRSSGVPHLMAPREGVPSYAALIASADSIFVTADSVAMVADAVMTRKPVGIIPIAKSALGSFAIPLWDSLRPGKRLRPRDLRFFWRALREHGFGGTLDSPVASDPPDYTALVADRVRQLLAPPRPATVARDSDR